jgi:hypothetical protein
LGFIQALRGSILEFKRFGDKLLHFDFYLFFFQAVDMFGFIVFFPVMPARFRDQVFTYLGQLFDQVENILGVQQAGVQDIDLPLVGVFLNMLLFPPDCGENENLSHAHYTPDTSKMQAILSIIA